MTQGTPPTHIDLDAVEATGPAVDTLEVTPAPLQVPEQGAAAQDDRPASPEGVEPDAVEPKAVEPEAVEPAEVAEDGAQGGAQDGPAAATEQEQVELDLDALPSGARGALEAVLMVVEEPIDEMALASALTVPVSRVRELLAELVADYDEAGRGFELRQVAGGWRIYSRAEYHEVVERFVLDGQTARLTQAALETLAIVAYRQPVSRARVSAIRGVSVDAVMRTLVTRGLVEESGHDPETGAVLYRTTAYFLQRIGLASLEELPALAPFLPEVDALDELGIGGTS